MRLPFLFLAATLSSAAFAAEPREVFYQGLLTPQNIVPTFDKGYLLVYDYDKIDLYAPDGSPLYSVSAEVPSAKIAKTINTSFQRRASVLSSQVPLPTASTTTGTIPNQPTASMRLSPCMS